MSFLFRTSERSDAGHCGRRLDEPIKLSLGVVASLQSRLPFHLAKSL
jgi:hypothetical protein